MNLLERNKLKDISGDIKFQVIDWYDLDETEDANYLILVGININGDNEADIQTFLGAGTYLYS